MSEQTDAMSGGAPVHVLGGAGAVDEWLVLGPFPNPEPTGEAGGGDYREGFYHDYLESVGGEASAAIEPHRAVRWADADGAHRETAPVRAGIDEHGRIDGDALFPDAAPGVLYASFTLESPKEQRLFGYFGSTGSARLWVDGELVLSFYHKPGRMYQPGDDFFTTTIRAGRSRVLLKVESGGPHGWFFGLEMVDAGGRRQGAEYRKFELMALQAVDVAPKSGGYVFAVGELPDLDWAHPDIVEEIIGPTPLDATWYQVLWRSSEPGHAFRQVNRADVPGAYLAILEGTSPDGMSIRRGLTFHCVMPEWEPPKEPLHAFIDALPILAEKPPLGMVFGPHAKATWHQMIEALEPAGGVPAKQEDAELLNALDRSRLFDRPLKKSDEPMVVNGDVHAGLRFTREGKSGPSPLAPPERIDPPAPVLRRGSSEEAGMKPGTDERLRDLCGRWAENSDQPFANLVARNGVVFHQEGFGAGTDRPMWIASITKFLSSLLFARFVDQGLMDYDDPVGRFLPDFPTDGERVLRIRNLLNHTSGLWGHLMWGGVYNPYLDNVIANGIEYLNPGAQHMYGGMGYDLCGRIVESITGRGVLRMMYDEIFEPLGLKDINAGDLGAMIMASVEDLGVLAQMVLNGGAYGQWRFFRPETLERMLPERLKERYPDLPEGLTWGMGPTWMHFPDPDAGKGDVPADATLLSRKAFGHGAASSAIFRVDPETGVIVTQSRDSGGKAYDEHVGQFYRIIHQGIAGNEE